MQTRHKRVLVACEFSGIVRDAFLEVGCQAWSCDLRPCERGPARHLQTNALKMLRANWDLMIAHPPCTHLAISGARWFKDKKEEQEEAVKFFMALANANIKQIAIENPVSIMSTRWRQPDQIIDPWMFGHGEKKRTCLWLKNLPRLRPTEISLGREERVLYMSSKNKSDDRSRTYTGIAKAMAEQWSKTQASPS